MQIAETITAVGSGFWGYCIYEIELRTRLTTYVHAVGRTTRTVSGYHLRFHNGSHSDFRAFPTDRSRAEFISKNFTQLEIREIPSDEQTIYFVAMSACGCGW